MASTSATLDEQLRRELDRLTVRELMEYVARDRLGLHAGHRTLRFVLSNGALRRTFVDSGPIPNEELEHVRFAS